MIPLPFLVMAEMVVFYQRTAVGYRIDNDAESMEINARILAKRSLHEGNFCLSRLV